MLNTVCTLTMSVALGAGPIYHGDGPTPGSEAVVADFSAAQMGGPLGPGGEQLYPFDSQAPWVHGYYQEMPAYGGYAAFNPYNYKHVLSQSQAAGGWGMSPTMPYSQQYWHPYQAQAAAAQLQNIGNAEYAAEMARLRARQEYQNYGYRPVPQEVQQAASGHVIQASNVDAASSVEPEAAPQATHYGPMKRVVPRDQNQPPKKRYLFDRVKELLD